MSLNSEFNNIEIINIPTIDPTNITPSKEGIDKINAVPKTPPMNPQPNPVAIPTDARAKNGGWCVRHQPRRKFKNQTTYKAEYRDKNRATSHGFFIRARLKNKQANTPTTTTTHTHQGHPIIIFVFNISVSIQIRRHKGISPAKNTVKSEAIQSHGDVIESGRG